MALFFHVKERDNCKRGKSQVRHGRGEWHSNTGVALVLYAAYHVVRAVLYDRRGCSWCILVLVCHREDKNIRIEVMNLFNGLSLFKMNAVMPTSSRNMRCYLG